MNEDHRHNTNGTKSCAIPIIRGEEKLLSTHCQPVRGGTMTIKPPPYVLIVTNPPPAVTTN